MIESPRWLAVNSKWNKSAQFLRRIAKVNGTINGAAAVINESYLRRAMANVENEESHGIRSFFMSGRNIAKNTILLIICW